MRINYLILVCLIGLAQPSSTQTPDWHILGHVQDENGHMLAGATIQVLEKSVVSDSTGKFLLQLEAPDGVLTVRCIGYFPQRLNLDTAVFEMPERVANLKFVLDANAISLPEIAISSEPIEWVFKEDFQSNLLDYDFAGEDLIFLVQQGKKYFLRRVTDKGRQISELRLPEPATLLHRSCTGDLHVLGISKAWEITLTQNQIDTLPAYPTQQFRNLIEPCVLEYNGNYIFQKTGPYRQSVQYDYYGPDRRKRTLAVVQNALAEAQLRRRHWEIISGYLQVTQASFDQDAILDRSSPLLQPEAVLRPENLARLSESNQLMKQVGFFSTLALDSVYAPLIRMNEQLYLLDHINNQLICILKIPQQTICAPLNYHQNKGFRKEVLVDEAQGRAYGRFSASGGQLVLKEINFETGGVRKSYTLSMAPYLIENFKIRNGVLYFIGQPMVTIPNRRLYKMNIFAFAPSKPE